MTTDIKQTLPTDPEALQKMVASLQSELSQTKEALAQSEQARQTLLEQFKLAQHKRFGQSSEGYPGQGELFDEAEAECDAEEAPQTEEIQYTRTKQPKRKPLPDNLPREEIVHDLPESEKVCDCCGGELHKMGEARSEKLEFIPAQVKVIEQVRPKYSCRHCEKTATKVDIKIQPVPPSPIPKGIATPSLLAHIITSKYQFGLPLYRQESLFKQHGIELNRKTMAQWMIKCAELFKPLYLKLRQIQLAQPVIHADETRLKVINQDKSTCYMWVYCTGTDSPGESEVPNIALYDYQPGRSGQYAVDYLNGFNGYLQVDGYAGYNQTAATLVGCWAHARRKFLEAEVAQGKNKSGKATWALNHIGKLYALEKRLKTASSAERYQARQEKALPLLETFKSWLEKSAQAVLPKTLLGKAIQYTLNQWDSLVRYVEDGNLKIDNNRAERAIKPFVIGRKNWLFSNTASGAQASAILYSMVETAKANGLSPFDYIMRCLEHIAKTPEEVESILPFSEL